MTNILSGHDQLPQWVNSNSITDATAEIMKEKLDEAYELGIDHAIEATNSVNRLWVILFEDLLNKLEKLKSNKT